MYTKILVPLDGSPTSQKGLDEAIALAKLGGARLLLLHVVEDFPLSLELASVASFEDGKSLLTKAGRRILDDAAALAQRAGVAHETVLHAQTAQRAADAILETATQRGCDLIVMGTHGRRGFNRLVMGSNAELVLRGSTLPVLCVRRPE